MIGDARIRPRPQPRSIVGSARDLDVMRSLSWAGYLSTRQVARIHFPSRRTAQRRLRALLDHQLVRARLQGAALHLENTYTLRPAGVARLESVGTVGASVGRLPRPQKLLHGLAIRDVFGSFLVAERAGALKLRDFRFDGDLTTDAIFRAAGIVPDGWADLHIENRRLAVGCEVDLGTETKRALAAKLTAWRELLRHREFGDTVLLIVIDREGRRQTMDHLLTETECPARVVLLRELMNDEVGVFHQLFAPAIRAACTTLPPIVVSEQGVAGAGPPAFRIVE